MLRREAIGRLLGGIAFGGSTGWSIGSLINRFRAKPRDSGEDLVVVARDRFEPVDGVEHTLALTEKLNGMLAYLYGTGRIDKTDCEAAVTHVSFVRQLVSGAMDADEAQRRCDEFWLKPQPGQPYGINFWLNQPVNGGLPL